MAEDLDVVVREFESFFEAKYLEKINVLLAVYPRKKSLNVDYSDLDSWSVELADELLRKPDKIVWCAEKALSGLVAGKTVEEFDAHVRFFNLPDQTLLIQDAGAAEIERLICLHGIITKRAEVRPRVEIAFYKCLHCDAEYKVPMTKKAKPLEVCEACKRRVKLVEEQSYFVNIQRVEIQELLERVRGGAPAGRMELLLEDDLVNSVVPGDNVEITGVMRIRPPIKVGEKTGVYLKYVDVMHIRNIQREFEEIEISKEEEDKIVAIARDPQVFEKIIQSIAPSIYGYEEIKMAVALQLFGGNPDKRLPEGGKIRSDIHLLIVGDPGSAKSRMLQYVTEIAPKSIYVSGKSVSAAGLSAAAEKDDLGDGGWVLKAGALVLASGGIAGVDELDKIDPEDRAALHEIMETQTVSIAKAGIVARLKAETSIIAAANPKFGRFDPNKLPADQFDIPPTLLSRFDLIFPLRDILDEEKDRQLATFLLASHTAAGKKEGDKLVEERRPISIDLLRKYIAYARRKCKPILLAEANDKIKDYYVDLRKLGQRYGSVPITPRQIEGLIRLSEASAKSRLSDRVEAIDAERAIKLSDFVLKQIAMDKTTGQLDIDIIATGQPKSRVDKFNQILSIIEGLQREYDEVDIRQIMDEAKQAGIDATMVERFIDDRVTKGDFYKPKHGFIKIVKRVE
ncbi:minichromosome maintenance protein MCM [Candidatus Micrarchaeota archaeon]|nr:minichromosome maintenance protein MCM [Candidatus Micrarchaeota archaeon]